MTKLNKQYFTAAILTVIASLLCLFFTGSAWAAPPKVVDWSPPAKLSLCGEPVPLNDRSTAEMFGLEYSLAAEHHAKILLLIRRSTRYFPALEKTLAVAKAPADLKYVPAVLTLLDDDARYKTTAGMFKLTSKRAVSMGLRVDKEIDERLDYERAAAAVFRRLKRLKKKFGSWTLATAAFFMGPDKLAEEMREQETNNFYRLDIPGAADSMVLRMAALKTILENRSKYGYYVPPDRLYQPKSVDRINISLSKKRPIVDAALAAGTDYKTIKELNPKIRVSYFPPGSYEVLAPAGLGRKLSNILK